MPSPRLGTRPEGSMRVYGIRPIPWENLHVRDLGIRFVA